MNAPLEIIKDPSDGELMVLFDFGDGEVGIVFPDRGTRREDELEIWFDHAGSGNGCNNLVLVANWTLSFAGAGHSPNLRSPKSGPRSQPPPNGRPGLTPGFSRPFTRR